MVELSDDVVAFTCDVILLTDVLVTFRCDVVVFNGNVALTLDVVEWTGVVQ